MVAAFLLSAKMSILLRFRLYRPHLLTVENLISMLISHKHKFIFIHIAKTGGSSISSALMPYCKPRIQETAHRYLSLLNIHVLRSEERRVGKECRQRE